VSLDVVRRALELWNAQEEPTEEALSQFARPDMVVDLSANVLNPGVHRGYDGFRRFVEEVGEAWAEFRVEPQEFLEAGDQVVVLARARATGRGSGLQVDSDVAIVFTVRDGRLASLRVEPDREAARRSVGLD
jgi:ketosteroid isomerase-like protein